MAQIEEVPVGTQSLDRFGTVLGEEALRRAGATAAAARERLAGRTWWNVNSTAQGGGVAEMLRDLLPYVRGAGIDARWVVMEGESTFFRLTKRLHHAIHGSAGDGSPLGADERAAYEAVTRANVDALLPRVRRGDIVLLHDPQTAGMAPPLVEAGATVIWRSHIGTDTANDQTRLAWDLLAPYLTGVAATVFSRAAYVPDALDGAPSVVIAPSIDAFSSKNRDLPDETVRAVLVRAGLVGGTAGSAEATFEAQDDTPRQIEREASVVSHQTLPSWDTPLVVQISRWDPLKDPEGVMRGFVTLLDGPDPIDAAMVLAGPDVTAVADDPEGATTFAALLTAWQALPEAHRSRVHLANLPMADIHENATIVNALQRHAAIIVQKSLQEGFGLTVTEAMWKGRPIVASAVGGIQDQIEDGVHGLLLPDPADLGAYTAALRRLLTDRAEAERLGAQAKERVREEYLGVRHLTQYAELLERLDGPAA